jgi:hypothetical protein
MQEKNNKKKLKLNYDKEHNTIITLTKIIKLLDGKEFISIN